MERWLSLTVLEQSPVTTRPRVYISIPKRTVKLAVRRNRLKRVLREAVRRDPFFEAARVYRLQVRGIPVQVDLASARKTLQALHA